LDVIILLPMGKLSLKILSLVIACLTLTQCATSSGGGGNLGGPTVAERNAKIASEPRGDFFYGRRYVVEKTRFWGYLRKPGESWNRAKLVIFREDRKLAPDRLSENGPPGQRYTFDHNYEYRIRGNFTGDKAYDPNSNQYLPVFMLSGYELLDKQPGWLFSPADRYDRNKITMVPR